jgi:N12 class adenine-specific DNA methylase
VFGEVVTDWELSPSGKYKQTSRFAKFVNMPELMQRYLSASPTSSPTTTSSASSPRSGRRCRCRRSRAASRRTWWSSAADQAQYIGVPKVARRHGDGGVPERARWSGVPSTCPRGRRQKGADNMLKIMSDARKAALDMRLIDPTMATCPGSKVHIAADNIKRIYASGKPSAARSSCSSTCRRRRALCAKEEARSRS